MGISTASNQQSFIQTALADETSVSSTLSKNNSSSDEQSSITNASNQSECDTACMEKRKAIIAERRAMMRQSRSNTNRGDILKLSEQRAALYKTDY